MPPRPFLLDLLNAFTGGTPAGRAGPAGHRRPILLWTERALWAIGVLCLGVVLYVMLDARWFAWVQGRRLDQALAARAAQTVQTAQQGGAPAAAPPAAGPGAPGAQPEAPSSPAGQTDDLGAFQPAAPAAPPAEEGSLVGRIEIPRLGVSSLVLEGVTSATLRHGVGHIPRTSLPQLPGNVGLAGHRDTVFRALKDIRQGDLILLDTLAGSFRYQVDWTQVVQPDDLTVLAAADRPELTLVTCYPFYYVGSAPERFIVRGHRVDDPGGGFSGPSAPSR